MNKTLASVLCLTLIFVCAVGSGESKTTEFEPKMTAMMDSTAEVWMASSANRSMFTVTLFLDLNVALSGRIPVSFSILSEPSYVGRWGQTLVLAGLSRERTKLLVLMYRASQNTAAYSVMDVSGESQIKGAMEIFCKDEWYTNDLYEVNDTYQRLLAALGLSD